jgi:hypothetical protein
VLTITAPTLGASISETAPAANPHEWHCEGLVRPHTAKHQHCLLRKHNLAPHDFVNMVLQLLYQRRPLCDPIKRQRTNLGILKRDRIGLNSCGFSATGRQSFFQLQLMQVPLAICSLFVGQVSIPREDFLARVITLPTLWSHLRNDGRR